MTLSDVLRNEIARVNGDDEFITDAICRSARTGALLLVVGAGVSMSVTPKGEPETYFPSWSAFLQDLVGGLDGFSCDCSDPLGAADSLEREYKSRGTTSDFICAVERSVYKRAPAYEFNALNGDLLFSVCAIVAKARRIGPVFIVNLNYDDLLEWFLSRFGYSVQVVSTFPCIIESPDVVSIHPHGFLPRSSEFSSFRDENIVLGGRKFREAGRQALWYHELIHVLIGKSFSVYLGLSGDDPHIMGLYEGILDRSNIRRVLGVRLVSGDRNLDKNHRGLEDAGVASKYFTSHSDIPAFLFETAKVV